MPLRDPAARRCAPHPPDQVTTPGPTARQTFELKAEGKEVEPIGLVIPVTVGLTIGDDVGPGHWGGKI